LHSALLIAFSAKTKTPNNGDALFGEKV